MQSRVFSSTVRSDEVERDLRIRYLDLPVALVSMPFVSPFHPSLQLGLLKAIALQQGFPAATFHLHLALAKLLGLSAYSAIGQMRGKLLGDWLFSLEAFGDQAPDPDNRFLDDFADGIDPILAAAELSRQKLIEVRTRVVPAYLDGLMTSVPWHRFRVVGFTCTFQQSVASFALARRLKARHPKIITLFGGANFDGDMGREFVKSVEVIDYVVIGEGDETFPALLAALAQNSDPADVDGIAFRRQGKVVATKPRAPFRALDALPTTLYDEYFERAEMLELLSHSGRRSVDVPVESARGCWWGEKHHCTFCGLNGGGMAFRSKSPERVIAELSEMASRYHNFRFSMVDNIIDNKYYHTLLKDISERRLVYELFYEVKANLGRQHIRQLRDAGVRRIQPGIESLNSDVLRLMNKGISAAQNVNALRWARHYDIQVSWNILWGFPAEQQQAYDEQEMLLPMLWHLQPPSGGSRIWMERFSPIFFDRQAFPATHVRPEASYAYIYPEGVNQAEIAYFFDYELQNTLPSTAYDGMLLGIDAWKKRWEQGPPPKLTFWTAVDYLQIEDLRDLTAPGAYNFDGPLAAIYAACSERPQSASSLQRAIGSGLLESEIEEACMEFARRGLMMRDGPQFLSLALPATGGR